MVARSMTPYLRKLMQMYPIVTVTGPRQSGKTTLVRHLFPEFNYVNLEIPDIRANAIADPRGFLLRHQAPSIFDEIQHVPMLLSYLQAIVDEAKQTGMYVLTGSHQPLLQAPIGQYLAGRTGLAELLPLTLGELKTYGITKERNDWLLHGFMPRLTTPTMEATQLYRDYFRTYVERDARQLVNIRNLHAFETFVRLLAGRVGQILNLSSLASDVGVSVTTLRQWLNVLEASYIVRTIHPYYRNFGKRLIKSPKVYFVETGLAAYLLGLRTAQQVDRDPLLGGLFENMVVMEILKHRMNSGQDNDIYFFRDSQGFEVDLLLTNGGALIPIEIKSTYTPNETLYRGLQRFQSLTGEAQHPVVVYAGETRVGKDVPSFCNFMEIDKIIR